MQLTHDTTNFEKKVFPIIILCDHVNNAPNIGSLFRISDAFGVQEIVFCNTKIVIPSRKMLKTSRATEKYIPYKHIDNIHEFLLEFKKTHQIIALEITENSLALQHHFFNFDKPIILVIGDENFGVSDSVLELANSIIHIDMFGSNSSMNVVQATNISLYEITKQFNKLK